VVGGIAGGQPPVTRSHDPELRDRVQGPPIRKKGGLSSAARGASLRGGSYTCGVKAKDAENECNQKVEAEVQSIWSF